MILNSNQNKFNVIFRSENENRVRHIEIDRCRN